MYMLQVIQSLFGEKKIEIFFQLSTPRNRSSWAADPNKEKRNADL